MIHLLIFLLLSQSAGSADVSGPLVTMEELFCRTLATKGVRDAFLQFIADDGVLFRPHPVRGKDWLLKSASSAGLLEWKPAQDETSAGADFGYTTGPYRFRKSSSDKPAAFGCYLTVWEKQADGSWKFVLDAGINTPEPQSPAAPPRHVTSRPGAVPHRTGSLSAQLLQADRDFASATALEGMRQAYSRVAAEDIIVYRPGSLPLSGTAAMVKSVDARTGPMIWNPLNARTARVGDLGFTYGTAELRTPEGLTQPGHYVRIWRNSKGTWKIAVDLLMAPK